MELPEIGSTFQKKYRVDEILGEGGFARVYLATDVGAQRTVALKVLKPEGRAYSRDVESRFNREVKIVANLRDPHTVTMFDFGRTPDGLLFMVFEYIPGDDLSRLLRTRGRLGDGATIHILRQVLFSLREAHQGGLLHRDIKPENIRVYEYLGDPLRVTVLDFGIAKPLNKEGEEGSTITHAGSIIGTPKYMSPEQLLEQELTPASDIYSLGLVAYEMIVGESAIKGNQLSDQLRVLAGEELRLPPHAHVGPALRNIVERMISREAGRRMQTADQVIHALDSLDVPPDLAQIGHDATGALPSVAPAWTPSAPSLTPPGGANWTPQSSPGWTPQSVPAMTPPAMTPPAMTPPSSPAMTPPHSTIRGTAPAGSVSNKALLGVAAGAIGVIVLLAVVVIVLAPASEGDASAVDEPAAPPSAPERAPVVAAPQEPVDENTKVGCLAKRQGGTEADVRHARGKLYIPKGYDRANEHALTVVFRDAKTEVSGDREERNFGKFADDTDTLLLIVGTPGEHHDFSSRPWEQHTHVRAVDEAIDDVLDHYCVDEARVYMFGHGRGGRGVERFLSTTKRTIAAAATSSFRQRVEEEYVLGDSSVPFMHIGPTGIPHAPVEGGRECMAKDPLPLIALRDHLTRLRNQRGCTEESESWPGDSSCRRWLGCRADFVSCEPEGGREWKTGPDTTSPECGGEPTDIAHLRVLTQFFEEHGLREPSKP